MGELAQPVKITDNNFLNLSEKIIITYTRPNDYVLIPYMQWGAFAFEAAINERQCLVYDTNPLIKVNFESEFFYPSVAGVKSRLAEIKIKRNCFESDKKHFFDPQTFDEVMSVRAYLEGAPKDAINLWIKRLVGEALKSPFENNLVADPEYIDVKEFAMRTYKAIFDSIDPMKLLILHHYIPEFFSSENKLDEKLDGHKVKMIYYAPYTFDVNEYYEKNLLKMWFCDVSKEELLWYAGENKDENHYKKDFLSLHKKLESGGVIFVEKLAKHSLDAFFKLALFYGYENVQAFCSEKGREIYLLRKISV